MMEMKVNNGVFYLLDAGDEKWIYDAEKDAIDALKNLVSRKKGLDTESMSILRVDTSGETWEIKSIPWSKIAVELMKGG